MLQSSKVPVQTRSGTLKTVGTICPNVAGSVQCVCVILSIRERKHIIAAACLFSLAIFSHCPCEGPHNHSPTVGSSGLQYNSALWTRVINLCHLFIHPAEHTCSLPVLPTTPMCQKYTPHNEHIPWNLLLQHTTIVSGEFCGLSALSRCRVTMQQNPVSNSSLCDMHLPLYLIV